MMDESKKAEFLNTTGHIIASEYAISRLPELESYCQSIPSQQPKDRESNFVSKGGKCSNRHLRRRNGSYKPRRHHRFPTKTKIIKDEPTKLIKDEDREPRESHQNH